MTRQIGDRAVGSTIYFNFNTHDADGAPITLAGTPAVACYKNSGTTEDTSGITLTVDFDSRTGLHNVAIDTSQDATFYSSGDSFAAVITAGTVAGVSVVGAVLAEFTLGVGVNVTRWLGDVPTALETAVDVAGEVWSNTTRTLTAIDEDSVTLDLDATIRAALGMSSANLDTEIAAILEDTGTTIPGLIAALNNLSAAQVNAEVLDVLNTDTFAMPGQGNPPATPTPIQMLGYLYKSWRNRSTQTATQYSLYADDATTVDQKATVADDGTTYSRTEIAAGP